VLGDALNTQLGGVLVIELAIACGLIVLGYVIRWMLVWMLGRALYHRFGGHADWQDSLVVLLLRYVGAIIVLCAVFFACAVLTLPREPIDWEITLWRAYLSFGLVWCGLLLVRTLEYATDLVIRRTRGEVRLGNRQVLPIARDVAKVAVGVVVALLAVQTWGYNATALLAGVGLGGLAVAFAAQDTIANLFGTMVIYSDHPYKVGDHVILSGVEGTVEEIGVRSTRIRKFDRTLVSVPNKSVANENVFNLTLMNHRRIRFRIALAYETTPDQLESALEAIRLLLSTQPGIMPNQHWVHLFEWGPYSQDLQLQCFTESAEYEVFLEVQEELMLRVRRKLDSLGLSFAYPTQVVRHVGDALAVPGSWPPERMPEA
jgi:MscS family membrane protein